MFRHSLKDLARVAAGARLVVQQVSKLAEAGQFRSVPVRWNQGLRGPLPTRAAAEDASHPASSVTPVLRDETITPVSSPESSEEVVPQGWRADPELDLETKPLMQQGAAETDRQRSPSAQAVQGVPTSSITRAMHFGGLGLGLAAGAAAAAMRRSVGMQESEGGTDSLVMTEANVERLASTLCRLRGAALKVGQMLSFNDSIVLPPALQKVMERVRDGADWMPDAQLQRTLTTELGEAWRGELASFEDTPVAAASIGQVRRRLRRYLSRSASAPAAANPAPPLSPPRPRPRPAQSQPLRGPWARGVARAEAGALCALWHPLPPLQVHRSCGTPS